MEYKEEKKDEISNQYIYNVNRFCEDTRREDSTRSALRNASDMLLQELEERCGEASQEISSQESETDYSD